MQKQKIDAGLDKLFTRDAHAERERLINQKGRRADGTCLWIKENVIYRSWESGAESDGADSTLCIVGRPGQGQTMLSIFITEDLDQHCAESKAHIIFFLCDGNTDDCHDTKSVLRSLIYQIVMRQKYLGHHIVPYFDGDRQAQSSIASFEVLWAIFEKLVQDPAFQLTYW